MSQCWRGLNKIRLSPEVIPKVLVNELTAIASHVIVHAPILCIHHASIRSLEQDES